MRRYLLLLALSLLAPGVIEGRALLSPHPYWGCAASTDTLQWCGMRAFEARVLRQGELPLWNPQLLAGLPWQTGPVNVLHPGTVLQFLGLDSTQVCRLTIWLSLGLAMFFASAMLLWLGLRPAVSLAGGLVYAHGGFPLSHLYYGHIDILVSLAWSAAFLWAWLAAQRYAGVGWTVLAAGALAALLASAHFPLVYLSVWTVFALSWTQVLLGSGWAVPAWRGALLARAPEQRGSSPWEACPVVFELGARERATDVVRLGLRWLAVAGLAACLSAGQLLPLRETLAHSARPAHDPGYFTSFAVSGKTCLTLLVPHLFDKTHNDGFWVSWPVWEGHSYLSLLGLVGLAAALALPLRHWLPLALVTGLGLALAWDQGSHLLRLYAGLDPLVSRFRCPGRFVFVLQLLGPWALALGLEALFRGMPGPLRVARATAWALVVGLGGVWFWLHHSSLEADSLLSAVAQSLAGESRPPNWDELGRLLVASYVRVGWSFLVAGLGLALLLRPRLSGAGLLGLLLLDLWWFASSWMITAAPGRFQFHPEIERFFSTRTPMTQRVLCDDRWLNLGMTGSLAEVGGYVPMAPRSYAAFWGVRRGHPAWPLMVRFGGLPDPARLSLQGTRYHLTRPGSPHYPWTLVLNTRDACIWENPAAAPRAFMVHQLLAEANPERLAVRNARAADQLRQVAAVEPALERELAPRLEPPDPDWLLQNLVVEANRVRLEVTTARAGVLLLSDSWAPGWKAHLDETQVSVLALNGGLHRGVWMPRGHHSLRMDYWPDSLTRGLVIGGVSWLGWGLVMAWGLARARGSSVRATPGPDLLDPACETDPPAKPAPADGPGAVAEPRDTEPGPAEISPVR